MIQQGFSTGQLAIAARASFMTVNRVATRLGIEPERTQGGHRRFTGQEAKLIVAAIRESREDPRQLIETAI